MNSSALLPPGANRASLPRRTLPGLHPLIPNRCLDSLLILAFLAQLLSSNAWAGANPHDGKEQKPHPGPVSEPSGRKKPAQALPPLPRGVAEIKFRDFFKQPIGPAGLEITDTLRRLEGRKVRLLGYMVRQEHRVPGMLLLSPVPVQVHDHDSELADDLPPSVVYVRCKRFRHRSASYTPKLLLLTGTLELGNQEEPDGRVSLIRLNLAPSPSSRSKSVQTAAHTHAHPNRF